MIQSSIEVTKVGCQRRQEFVLKAICKGTKMAITKQHVADGGQVGCSAVQGGAVWGGTGEGSCHSSSASTLLLALNTPFKPSVCFEYVRSSC